MSQSNRLSSGGRIDRSKPITFTFNGKKYQGFQGDTLASALLAQGEHFVARSWKYHRPRGILTAGVEEPNALVQLELGAYTVPNARATEVEIYPNLIASTVNVNPDLENDKLAINQKIARFIPAGFYYKTFKWPRSWWESKYEKVIREAAGLGKAPEQLDPQQYEKTYAHCDILVVGGGLAGLSAAWTAAKAGARVILVNDQAEFGGSLLNNPISVDGTPGVEWAAHMLKELQQLPDVTILSRSTAYAYQDHNLVIIAQRITDHLPIESRGRIRERMIKVRAKHVILATGAHERPLVFGNNDLPGVMLASAVSTYINRYAVSLGKKAVVFTNNDSAYQAAIDFHQTGTHVTVVDARTTTSGDLPTKAKSLGIEIISGAVVSSAEGKKRIQSAQIMKHQAGVPTETVKRIECDVLAMSGGWNPVVHLFAQSGGKTSWDEAKACFVPGQVVQKQSSIGAAAGTFCPHAIVQQSIEQTNIALSGLGFTATANAQWKVDAVKESAILPLWLIGNRNEVSRGPKQFVDYQNDVSASDIYLAAREGYKSIEHVKRYTAMGFGTDQGKLGNINGMGILAEVLKQSIPETGTTTFRPNYTPVTFGTLAGRELGDAFTPFRKTCVHEWHVENGALFEDVGNWKRPWYFPQGKEDLHAAVARESLAVRQSVGMLDASTLGKIDIQGPDAVTLLNWMYTNPWNKLDVGKARYGIMLDENGMVFDDGVTVRLSDQHFLMSTTTGGAARVLDWMERWLQTEWPHLKVHLTSVTDHFATFAVAGPNSRKVLQKVCKDIDFSNEAFPFMTFQEGTIQSVFARIVRISFSGELSYEVNVPANMGRAVWEILMEAGKEFNITPYGTETMHVLRAEKGYIIVGQDTDGSVSPYDLGMGGLCSKAKDFLGKRSLTRSDTAKEGRKQLVGLLTQDPKFVLPEGSQVIAGNSVAVPAPMLGHVTSSYFSPILNRSIAMAVVKGGFDKMGQTVNVSVPEAPSGMVACTITSTVFYDPEGVRQNVV